MNFQLTEEHLMIQKMARDFAQQELLPGVIERDEHQKFPAEQVKKMGELGFLGMMVDPKYGGGDMVWPIEFAQLIVRKCMSFQDEAGVYSKFDMADAIAKHFGVEE